MLAFFQGVVELPAPIHTAILAGVTLLFGMLIAQLAKVEALKWLANFLGQYIETVSLAVAGAIVIQINNWLAQIPLNWEGVGIAALQLVVAVLAAFGLLTQFRKARAAFRG